MDVDTWLMPVHTVIQHIRNEPSGSAPYRPPPSSPQEEPAQPPSGAMMPHSFPGRPQ